MARGAQQATMRLILQLCVVLLLFIGVGNHVWGKMDVGEKARWGFRLESATTKWQGSDETAGGSEPYQKNFGLAAGPRDGEGVS